MRRYLAILSVIGFLICGIYAVRWNYDNGTVTYDGSDINVLEIYEHPDEVELNDGYVGGIADIIVKEDLSKTMAANNVAAVVYDFRGFDTLGESFILLTAIAGSFIILRSVTDDEKKAKKGGDGSHGI
ncbi:MAG: hypothetical protein IJ061_02855 [Lachnospiraceae bacterium]|nr:hypothetical protein [Lachnospiraceae bacterium]